MKLSEAIQLGAMSVPAMRGRMVFYNEEGNVCGACALGTALIACGWWAKPAGREVNSLFPVFGLLVAHPVTHAIETGWSVINSLFETHHWTREQIADWVETLEAQQPVTPEVRHESDTVSV